MRLFVEAYSCMKRTLHTIKMCGIDRKINNNKIQAKLYTFYVVYIAVLSDCISNDILVSN